MKHTPGPWKVERPLKESNYLCILKPLPNGETCFIGRANVGLEEGEVNANAHLIAAAPEMLEALELASRFIDKNVSIANPEQQPMIKHLMAAIAKAKGGG